MNRVIFSLFPVFGLLISAFAGAAPMKPVWTVKEHIDAPESAYFDPGSRKIFVSNVSGSPGEKDGKGSIVTVTVSKGGKTSVKPLVSGLNAPKGLRAKKGVLYVTDINEVVSVEIKSGKILGKTEVPGAVFLNDIAIDEDGKIYVSDTIASKIFVINQGKSAVFAEGPEMESPNGLLLSGGKLIVAAWGLISDPATFGAKVPGHLFGLDLKTKAKTLITKDPIGNLDGLEVAANGDFIVSDWVAGKVWRVTKDGASTLILDGFKNAADIGMSGSTLLVPDMGSSTVSAFYIK